MIVANQVSLSNSAEVTWEELLPELSQRWLVVEWEHWARPKQAATAALVEIGAAELRLRYLVRKEASPPIVEAIVVIPVTIGIRSGSYSRMSLNPCLGGEFGSDPCRIGNSSCLTTY